MEKGGRKVFVDVDKIRYIEAKDDYSCIYTDQDRYLSTISLAKLEAKLTPHGFFRVHRGYIVNLDYVEDVEVISSGILQLGINGIEGKKISVSRRRVVALKRALGSRPQHAVRHHLRHARHLSDELLEALVVPTSSCMPATSAPIRTTARWRASRPVTMCLGNNDWGMDYGPDVKRVTQAFSAGLRWQLCHYEERLDLLTCDIAICGHTHRPFYQA